MTDFAVIWLAGAAGSFAGVLIGAVLGVEALIIPGLIGQFGGSVLTFWLIGRSKDPGELDLSMTSRDVRYVFFGLGLQLVVALIISPLMIHLFPDGRPPQYISELIGSPDTPQSVRMFLFLAAVIFVPIVEEIVFRGVLLKALIRRGVVFATVVSSVVFAAVHLAGLRQDRFLAAAAVTIPPLLLLGALLGWMTVKTGRLGPAIFLHSGWNLLAAIFLLIPPELLEQAG